MATKQRVSQKYNSRGIWIDRVTLKEIHDPTIDQKRRCIYFGSTLECRVFSELIRMFGNKLQIAIHQRIKIADFKITLKGYQTINFWKPDFILSLRNPKNEIVKQCIVEAKGLVVQPFPFQYALCRQKYPETPIVIISHVDDIPVALATIKNLLVII